MRVLCYSSISVRWIKKTEMSHYDATRSRDSVVVSGKKLPICTKFEHDSVKLIRFLASHQILGKTKLLPNTAVPKSQSGILFIPLRQEHILLRVTILVSLHVSSLFNLVARSLPVCASNACFFRFLL